VAEYLSHLHSVTIISHTLVAKELFARKLNIDLSAVEFLILSERPALELASITKEYDLFINASHMDFIPSQAPRSALMVYFPVRLNYATQLRRRLGFAIKRWLMVPSFKEGVFSLEIIDGIQARRAKQSMIVELPSTRYDYSVNFKLASQDLTIRRASIFLDGHLLRKFDLPYNEFVHCRIKVTGSNCKAPREMVIQAEVEEEINGNQSPFKMVLSSFEIDHPLYRLYQLLFERCFKELGLRLHSLPPYSLLDIIDTYDVIWANSEFTKKWIKKYWNRNSFVLPPPVDVEHFKPMPKRNQILSVGRFFAGSHNKKHLVMIAAFKHLVDHGLTGWELHLAGGTTPGITHDAYLQRVYAEARGYPIVIHTDVPFDELVRLYGESAIYWHASGFGEDENRKPIKFEHFGITTVEAMASGCVPVVIGKGGQPEIVKHGRNGFLWYTIGELKALTRQLIADASLRQRLASAAVNDSRRYDRAHFHARLRELLQQIRVD
jgi:glycosyltransferase involved in cell wall biosynthesis